MVFIFTFLFMIPMKQWKEIGYTTKWNQTNRSHYTNRRNPNDASKEAKVD